MTSRQEYIEKLRKSGLRPTNQRINICKLLFNRVDTFHFTINDLVKKIESNDKEKISHLKSRFGYTRCALLSLQVSYIF